MHEFENALDARVADLRERIAAARANEDEDLVAELIADLENLLRVAGSNDVDTSGIARVLAAETGALPVVVADMTSPTA